jgi:hypothetical protein
MLDGEQDANNAIVSINAGAGGTDAQDWADMLFAHVPSLGWSATCYKTDIIDTSRATKPASRSATFTVTGEYAYGYLKTEIGVHRLVRISPFNASGKRHTSFASVFVYPEVDQEIVIDIERKTCAIDVLPRQRGRRAACQQNLQRRAHHPHAHGHRCSVPAGKIPAPQQRDGHESAEGPALPARTAEAGQRNAERCTTARRTSPGAARSAPMCCIPTRWSRTTASTWRWAM